MTERCDQILGVVMCVLVVPPLFLAAVYLLGVAVEVANK